MDKYPHIVELIAVWEEQARNALPADAMLLNKQIRELRAALYATLPAKYVLVPMEPTEAMLRAGAGAVGGHSEVRWSAMIAARPEVV